MLKLDLEYQHEIFFIRINGSFTHKYLFKIDNYVIPVLKKHQIKKVIININNMKDIDESGVDSILKIKCLVKKIGGRVYLCGLNNYVKNKLKRIHLKTLNNENIAIKMIGAI